MIDDGKHNFNYDFSNQAVSSGDSGTYIYDGNLKRAKEIINGETIYSVYNKNSALIAQDNASSNKKTDYVTLVGQTFLHITNGVASYPLNDICFN